MTNQSINEIRLIMPEFSGSRSNIEDRYAYHKGSHSDHVLFIIFLRGGSHVRLWMRLQDEATS